MSIPQSGVDHQVGYIKEVTRGVTPATPAFQLLPYTGTTLKLTKEAIESERLGVPVRFGTRHGNRNVSGDVSAELVYGAFDALLASAVGGAWAANVLKSGVFRDSYSFVRKYGTIGVTLYTGVEVNTMALSVGQNTNAGLTFGLVGVDQAAGHTAPVGTTYVTESQNLPIAGFDAVIKKDGVIIAIVSSLELNTDRQITQSYVIGSKTTGAMPKGKLLIDGSMTYKLTSFALQDEFLNETRGTLEIEFTAPDTGDKLSFYLPNVLFNSADDDVSGDGEINVNGSFYGEYDETAQAGLVITRTPAAP